MTAPVASRMRRESQIETVTELQPDGTAAVSLRLSDGVGEVLALRLAVPDEETGRAMEKRFQKEAESICSRVMDMLAEA
mgnify:CR=1 FL=1